MLASMPLSEYWRWVHHIRQRGLPSRNVERQLQQLNAGVLNASGRFKPVTPNDFSLQPSTTKTAETGVDQNVLNQMLGDMSSLSFPTAAE
ncbi:hypothetical protein [Vibrio hippocampi]|uniref:Uncharacterized protein n=1 Tax=Vibrio hippocampi TaxID=654686 RepID=A0ABN8DNI5_9VIBR|nr:hypothetical protein [Vibrio hippocampi]CAH0531212.1 hypothetical protein VHP8226_04149 [Vibrio hippocampi]